MSLRVKSWRLPCGYRMTVVYERSPFVEMWGYRPLLIGVGFLGALLAMRVWL
jgi:hypothetical protein